MMEFWETSFRGKGEMWGAEPADAAVATLELFEKYGLKHILIPGIGYGRNAGIFLERGFEVTGIEISQTAVDLAKKNYGAGLKIYQGSVADMPFDQDSYDGIFCYALIHLLGEAERRKLIRDCFKQLNLNGYMVFVALSKEDARYGDGERVGRDTFRTRHGVNLFFYDDHAIWSEFGDYGLLKSEKISEPVKNIDKKPVQKFYYIVCRRDQ